jgi:iron(III) transport system substrate-binding protein
MARYAPHPEAAKAFLEFLVSPSAQAQLANANNEWPAAHKTQIANPALLKIGRLKPDPIEISKIAANQPLAARLIDRAGWK